MIKTIEEQLLDKIDSQEKRVSDGFFVSDKTVGALKVLVDLPKDVAEDVKVEIKVETYISEDDVKWKYYAGFTYIGGIYKDKTGEVLSTPIPPGFKVDTKELAGKYIKAEMTANKKAMAGVKIELWQ